MDKKMTVSILGKKIGMTQLYNQEGAVVPVTVIEAGPCKVLQIKSKDRDGYSAIQVGFGDKKEKRTTKQLAGHFKKSNCKPMSFLKEFRTKDDEKFELGQEIKADIFKDGDYVDVAGTSIGKGFQGGVKRWNWKGGPSGHGSMHHRKPGSIGATIPSRVVKGHHLPGRMGNVTTTVQNLRIMKADPENNILVVRGAVPGSDGTFLVINMALKGKKDPVKAKADESKKISKGTKTAKKKIKR